MVSFFTHTHSILAMSNTSIIAACSYLPRERPGRVEAVGCRRTKVQGHAGVRGGVCHGVVAQKGPVESTQLSVLELKVLFARAYVQSV